MILRCRVKSGRTTFGVDDESALTARSVSVIDASVTLMGPPPTVTGCVWPITLSS